MPLRAFIGDHEVVAPLVADEEWERLRRLIRSKAATLRMACCGNEGHLRISKLGTKHFVHEGVPNCNWAPETVYHLRAKQDIVEACQKVGFVARTEVSGADWRADVLATKGNVNVAFEVQWSGQTEEETRLRQRRYESAGVRCCWLMRKPPEALVRSPTKGLPVFPLSLVDDKLLHVKVGEMVRPLNDFTQSLLNRKIQFRTSATLDSTQRVTVVFFGISCWKCGHGSHIYYLEEAYRTCCGISADSVEGLEDAKGDEFAPEVVAAVQEFLMSAEGRRLHVGEIKRRFSGTVGHAYPSFGCPKCEAIYGEHFRIQSSSQARYEKGSAPAILSVEVICPRTISAPHPHWCSPTTGEFCDEF
jgi:hypothetical protein